LAPILDKPVRHQAKAIDSNSSQSPAKNAFEKNFKDEVSAFFSMKFGDMSPKKFFFLKLAVEVRPSWKEHVKALPGLQMWRYAPASEMPMLDRLVEEASEASGCAKPEICVSYALGSPMRLFNPPFEKTAAICVEDIFLMSISKGEFSIDEARSIIAHELGHYVKRHTLKAFLLKKAIDTALPIVSLASSALLAISGPSLAYAIIPIAIAGIIFKLGMPILNMVSRAYEYSADKFAAKTAGASNLISYLSKTVTEDDFAGPDVLRAFSALVAKNASLKRFFEPGNPGKLPWPGLVQAAKNLVAGNALVQNALALSRSSHPSCKKRIARLEKMAHEKEFSIQFQEY